ncbi:MAG: hypothetical protein JO322_00750 [Candidatus Eremiobacteraeota bacterium]|nr:hypothetical protein [Candidatus Eremiobacteraeota bacterium]
MTDEEIKPYVGKPVRVTLADRRVLAGVLRASGDEGHGHLHYAVVSDPVVAGEGREPVQEIIHGGDQIVDIEDASGDPAARL